MGQLFPDFDSREELLEKLQVSGRTLRRWEQLGLPVVRRGNLRLYQHDKIRAWVLSEPPRPEPPRRGRPRKRARA